MLFKQYDRNALASQEQSQNCSGRTTTNDTTGCLFDLLKLICFYRNIVLHWVTSKLRSHHALWRRMVRELNTTIARAKISRAVNCPAIWSIL